mgnify:CR=1 FL=1
MENTIHIDEMQIDNAACDELDPYAVLLADFTFFKHGTMSILRELFESLMDRRSFSALSSDELMSHKEELDRHIKHHHSLNDRLEQTITDTKKLYAVTVVTTYPDSLICKLLSKKIHRTSRKLEYVMFVRDIAGYLAYYSKKNAN